MSVKKRFLSMLIACLMVVALMPFGANEAYAAGNGGKTSVKNATITIGNLTYNGQIQKPAIKVVIGQVTLIEGTDYDLEFANPSSINAGKYKVTITGKGNYSGKTNEQYTINPKKITPAVTLSKKSYTYNGKVQQPAVTAVMDGTVKLTTADYSVSYSAGCKDVGGYYATVTMKGNYTGSKNAAFKINPKGTSLTRLKKGSKKITVKWKKQDSLMSAARISGYQIKLATNSKFTKNKKSVRVKGYSNVKKVVKNLKGGAKYYVKIRTYKIVNGAKYYSQWSKPLTVTTKK